MQKNRVLIIFLLLMAGCSSVRSALKVDSDKAAAKAIANPFGGYQPGTANAVNETMIFRTKKGDGVLEVEIPRANQDMSEFVIPISSEMKGERNSDAKSANRSLASEAPPAFQISPNEREASVADHEIVQTFPRGSKENDLQRRDIEQELGLIRNEEASPEKQKSYLALVDQVKQFYRAGRYEAALLGTDDLIREYPTNPRLYEMRGTLLERVGQADLALKSWKQALRFNVNNESLRRFIERKEKKRSLASP